LSAGRVTELKDRRCAGEGQREVLRVDDDHRGAGSECLAGAHAIEEGLPPLWPFPARALQMRTQEER
jgi:hypothetical protein